ncbi:Endonuclease/exonuclease/phosphatase, partial [Lenzites betulinus]
MKLATLNIRGGGPVTDANPGEKWMRINQLMKCEHLAVLAVQETHLTQEKVISLNRLFADSLMIVASLDPISPTAARGVAFVINKRVIDTEEGVPITELLPGRAIMISIRWGAAGTMRVLNVYAPNAATENATFWDNITSYFDNTGSRKPDILMGDCNVVEAKEDRAPSRPDPEKPRSSLRTVLRTLRLTDGWRATHPGVRTFTFTQESTGSQSRIDRIYIATDLMNKAADWKVAGSGVCTDHSLASVTVANYGDPFIGTGRWVIPKCVVTDRLFLDETVKEGRVCHEKMVSHQSGGSPSCVQEVYFEFKQNVVSRARSRVKALYAKWDRKIKNLKEKV